MPLLYKTIDLCAGIGGIRRGYELAGCFENVLSAEVDANACRTYEHLFGENPYNDITSEKFKAKAEQTDYDVLLAGFPCQSFSRAGKQQGFLDKTRGTLFFDVADIIRRTSPKAFMLENVDNLISHDKGRTFRTILDVLANDLEYKVIGAVRLADGSFHEKSFRKNFVRNSRDFGIPQNRPRVYIMGFSRGFFGDDVDGLPNGLPSGRDTDIYADLNDLLEMDAPDKYFLSSGYVETLERHKARHQGKGHGFGYMVVNTGERPVANAILATGGSGKERNLVIDPKQGMAGKVVPPKKTPVNDRGIRVMTPREWGKLQGFVNYAFVDRQTGEDRFSFPEGMSDTAQYKQFGNSVTIPVVETMARFMADCFVQLKYI